MSQKLRRNYT